MRLSKFLCLSLLVLGLPALPVPAQDTGSGSSAFGQLPDARDEHYLLMLAKQKSQIEALQNEIKRLKKIARSNGGASAMVSPVSMSVTGSSSVTSSSEDDTLEEQLRKAEAEVLKTKVTMHYNLGRVYHQMKKPLEAEKHYLYALSLAPKTADVHYNIGVLYDDYLHDDEKAKKHYEIFLLLRPGTPDAAMVHKWLSEL